MNENTKISDEAIYKVSLSREELAAIGKALSEQPYKQVAGLIQKLTLAIQSHDLEAARARDRTEQPSPSIIKKTNDKAKAVPNKAAVTAK